MTHIIVILIQGKQKITNREGVGDNEAVSFSCSLCNGIGDLKATCTQNVIRVIY